MDRDEVVELLGIGALCHEHVLVIGPPGTAKTRLLNRFSQMLDTTPFSYLLTRFTEPAEIFGPIDVKLFQESKTYEINTAGMLPEARVAFLDEVFQGSSAILNTLLTLINERTFYNGRKKMITPLVTLVGSSNEIPDDPTLAAFSDRFLLRCTLGYVSDDQIEEVLQLGWAAEQSLIYSAGHDGSGRAADRQPADERTLVPVSPQELSLLQQAVARIDLSEVMLTYVRIIQALRDRGRRVLGPTSRPRAEGLRRLGVAGRPGPGQDRATSAGSCTCGPTRATNPRCGGSSPTTACRSMATGTRSREVYEILEIDLHELADQPRQRRHGAGVPRADAAHPATGGRTAPRSSGRAGSA